MPDLTAAEDEIRHLRRALTTRPVIDQAKGMLIAQHGCTADEAFAMLATASQRLNRKVIDIAAAMVAGAAEPSGTAWPAQVQRDDAADQRDRAADTRDHAADDRDLAADDRELVADRRDRQAQVREWAVAEQEIDVDAVIAGALVRDQLAEYRDRRAEARDRAAEGRRARDSERLGRGNSRQGRGTGRPLPVRRGPRPQCRRPGGPEVGAQAGRRRWRRRTRRPPGGGVGSGAVRGRQAGR